MVTPRQTSPGRDINLGPRQVLEYHLVTIVSIGRFIGSSLRDATELCIHETSGQLGQQAADSQCGGEAPGSACGIAIGDDVEMAIVMSGEAQEGEDRRCCQRALASLFSCATAVPSPDPTNSLGGWHGRENEADPRNRIQLAVPLEPRTAGADQID